MVRLSASMPSYAMANLLPASCPKRIDWDYTTTRRRRPRVARRTSRSRRSGDEVGGLRALVLAPEHDLVAAGVLGQVHRLVRQLDEVIEVRVVVRQRRQADGDRHRAHGLQVLAGEGPRLDGVADALGEGARLLRPNVEEEEDELLAAKAVDAVVLPHGVAQDGGDLPQRDVANLVAVVVVEALEVVGVRHGDDGRSGPAGSSLSWRRLGRPGRTSSWARRSLVSVVSAATMAVATCEAIISRKRWSSALKACRLQDQALRVPTTRALRIRGAMMPDSSSGPPICCDGLRPA